VSEIPQFVSPSRTDQFLEYSYEEHFYDNYLNLISTKGGVPMPDRAEYLKTIRGPSPVCVRLLQEKYYKGCKSSSRFSNDQEDIEFEKFAKEITRKSIVDFIEKYGLKKDLLNEYLRKTQKDKFYMLYKNNTFHLQKIGTDELEIVSYEKYPQKNIYTAITQTGLRLNILLRWKNGNGIAYPAFQISTAESTTIMAEKLAAKDAIKTEKLAAKEAIKTEKLAAKEAIKTEKLAAKEAIKTEKLAAKEAIKTETERKSKSVSLI
jgi:hypothetical protein